MVSEKARYFNFANGRLVARPLETALGQKQTSSRQLNNVR